MKTKRILTLILALTVVVTSCFALFGCSYSVAPQSDIGANPIVTKQNVSTKEQPSTHQKYPAEQQYSAPTLMQNDSQYVINQSNIRDFCYVNSNVLTLPIKGIVIEFMGGGTTTYYAQGVENNFGRDLGAQGVVYIVPYHNPWAYGNEKEMRLANQLVEVVFDMYDLPDTTPIVSTGGSMGGLAALNYMRFATRTPIALAETCGVADLIGGLMERDYRIRNYLTGYGYYDMPFTEALAYYSPIENLDSFPQNAKYHIFHGTADATVNKRLHSDELVAQMTEMGFDVTYTPIPDAGHCVWPSNYWAIYRQFILDCINNNPNGGNAPVEKQMITSVEGFEGENRVNDGNISNLTYVNDKFIQGEIKGVVVEFMGLHVTANYSGNDTLGKRFGDLGILYVSPFHDPWAYMNDATQDFVNQVLDVVYKKYNLANDIPLVFMGGSMGGCQSLAFSYFSTRTPTAVVVNCPVTDLQTQYFAKPDSRRAYYDAFCHYDMPLLDALGTVSPYNNVDKMPQNTKYYIFHSDKDVAALKRLHSDEIVPLMQSAGLDVTYHVSHGTGHCELTNDLWMLYYQYIENAIVKG